MRGHVAADGHIDDVGDEWPSGHALPQLSHIIDSGQTDLFRILIIVSINQFSNDLKPEVVVG